MDYQNKSKAYYVNTRKEMLNFFPETAKTVLDIGCGQGTFIAQIRNRFGAETWGVEFMAEEAEKAKSKLDKVFSGPIEANISNLPDNYFDVIYCNDVLEHLTYPYDVLKRLRPKLTVDGRIISSLPNVRYHNTLRMYLFNKDWKYEKSGVMDFTHLRFFTKKSIYRMYDEAGYEILVHKGINKSRSLKPILINALLLFSAKDIFYPQYATVVGKSK